MNDGDCSSCPICLEALFVVVSDDYSYIDDNTETIDVDDVDDDDIAATTTMMTCQSTSTSTTGKTRTTISNTTTTMMKNIGTTVPCGHCMHVHCWEEWKMAASNHHHRNNNWNSTPKCPLCNGPTTAFVRLFVNTTIRHQPPLPMLDDDEDEDIEEEEEPDNISVQAEEVLDALNATVNTTAAAAAAIHTNDTNSTNHIISIGFDDDDDDEEGNPKNDTKYDGKQRSIITTTPMTASSRTTAGRKVSSAKIQHKNHQYRRMIHAMKHQMKQLRKQSSSYLDQCRTVRATMTVQQEEYTQLEGQHTTLERTQQLQLLQMEHVQLEKVRLQHQVDAVLEQLQHQRTIVQERDVVIQSLETRHVQQLKEYKKRKDHSMTEVQIILQERPKLLEQIRSLKEQLQQLQYLQRSRVLTTVLSSNTNTTTTNTSDTATHKQRKQLLRTISAGIDHDLVHGPNDTTTLVVEQKHKKIHSSHASQPQKRKSSSLSLLMDMDSNDSQQQQPLKRRNAPSSSSSSSLLGLSGRSGCTLTTKKNTTSINNNNSSSSGHPQVPPLSLSLLQPMYRRSSSSSCSSRMTDSNTRFDSDDHNDDERISEEPQRPAVSAGQLSPKLSRQRAEDETMQQKRTKSQIPIQRTRLLVLQRRNELSHTAGLDQTTPIEPPRRQQQQQLPLKKQSTLSFFKRA